MRKYVLRKGIIMTLESNVLIITAASVGFFHTIFGPDHYLPFVMISWARKWSTAKIVWISFFCGLGHIGSSVLLGLIGISLGLAAQKLELIESFRGNIAAWLLIAFGLLYFAWGLRRAYQKKSHSHSHIHIAETEHSHLHSHTHEHAHIHCDQNNVNITPWVLFIVFVFGPCEPLIPLLMYPAAKNSLLDLVMVTAVFGATTIATMLTIILFSRAGVNFVRLTKLQRFDHAIAGATILVCGLAIQLLGL